MADRIVLRKVYAVDSNTGLTMEPGNVLLTNSIGGTTWIPMLSTLVITGGSIIGNLPSTISSFSTLAHTTTGWLSTISSSYLAAICSLGSILDSKTAGIFTEGLGTLGYISAATLDARISTLEGSPSTISKMAGSLSSLGFINLSSLSSFAASQSLSTMSTVTALGTLGYVSTLSLISTVEGLGSAGYISTINTPISFNSTVTGLGTAGYVSTLTLNTLGSLGYISTKSLTSSLNGLGSIGYVSTGHLISTTHSLSNLRTNIRFDNVTSISIIGGENTNNFGSIENLMFVSTFFQSSLTYSGAQPGLQIQGNLINEINMEFSTALLRMDSFSSFIDYASRVTIEVYPSIAFTKLGTGANNVAILPISTLLKYGNTIIDKSVTTNYLYVGNTRTVLEGNNQIVDSSNMFNQPIRLSIPKGTFSYLDVGGNKVDNYTLPYTLYHYMPRSVNNAGLPNALHSNDITPYFGSTGSLFVSVLNSV